MNTFEILYFALQFTKEHHMQCCILFSLKLYEEDIFLFQLFSEENEPRKGAATFQYPQLQQKGADFK